MHNLKKPKILIVLSRFPYPVTDGTKHKLLHNISDALLADFDLEYLVVTMTPVAQADREAFEKTYGLVHLFQISKVGFVLRSLQSLYNGLPFQTSGYLMTSVRAWMRMHVDTYAAVYIHTVRMAPYATALSLEQRKKVLFDFNDAISLNYKGAKETAAFPLSWVYAIEEKRIRAYEKKLLVFFQWYNVVSPYDREYLLALLAGAQPSFAFACVAHGVPVPVQTVSSGSYPALYFIGQLDYAMNREAILFFLDTIWPVLIKEEPSLTLYVVGKTQSTAYDRYRALPGVVFTGFVPDVFAIAQKSAALVAPIRSGAGMPTKIIEACAFGMPVVTTPLGVRGITGVRPGENMYVLAETDTAAWVATLRTLVRGGSERDTMSEKARELFAQYYAEPTIRATWLALFKKIAGDPE